MIWGAICSFVSSVGSAISTAVSGIGSALSSFASTIGPVLGNIIDALKPIAEAIGNFANTFLQALGILKPDEQVEDLGERALQAAEADVILDRFDDFDSYMDALRKFELDPEVAAKRNPAEKLVAGLAVGTIGVEDKFDAERGSLNGLWLLPIANPDYFTPERMQNLVAAGRLGADVYDYLEQRLSGGNSSRFEKSLGAGMNETDVGTLYDALDSARANWADIGKQVQGKDQP